MNYQNQMDKIQQVKQTIDRIDDLLDEAMDLTYCIENLMLDMRFELEHKNDEELCLCL
jgi:hypothetical protein